MKIASTKERVLQFIEYKGFSKQYFYKKTGLKRGILDGDKLKTSIPDTFIAIIIAAFPEINLLWLLTGDGNMLNEDEQTAQVKQLGKRTIDSQKNDFKEKYYEALEIINSVQAKLIKLQEDNIELIKENEKLKCQKGIASSM